MESKKIGNIIGSVIAFSLLGVPVVACILLSVKACMILFTWLFL